MEGVHWFLWTTRGLPRRIHSHTVVVGKQKNRIVMVRIRITDMISSINDFIWQKSSHISHESFRLIVDHLCCYYIFEEIDIIMPSEKNSFSLLFLQEAFARLHDRTCYHEASITLSFIIHRYLQLMINQHFALNVLIENCVPRIFVLTLLLIFESAGIEQNNCISCYANVSVWLSLKIMHTYV